MLINVRGNSKIIKRFTLTISNKEETYRKN